MDVGVASVVTDAGQTEDHAFIVMAGIGLDADMIATASPELKKKVGWLAYVDSGVRALPKAKRFRIRYSMDDEEHRHHAHISTVLIGNCGTLPGNILLFPDARGRRRHPRHRDDAAAHAVRLARRLAPRRVGEPGAADGSPSVDASSG